MDEPIGIDSFIRAIRRLPSDKPTDDPRHWYRTQKEHWTGWLNEYDGPGAYGRQTDKKRDARFAYNHIVEPKMLLWLIDASGVCPQLIDTAGREAATATSKQQQSAIIRRYVPWEVAAKALWREPDTTEERFFSEAW